MGNQTLLADLHAAGYTAGVQNAGGAEFVVFDYLIPVGAHAGQTVQVGLQGHDWPTNPPGGPHIRPRILHPGDNSHHSSPLGQDAVYWSRPHPRWSDTARTLDEYLAHVRTLFAQFIELAA
jgi:hypothetical protein